MKSRMMSAVADLIIAVAVLSIANAFGLTLGAVHETIKHLHW